MAYREDLSLPEAPPVLDAAPVRSFKPAPAAPVPPRPAGETPRRPDEAAPGQADASPAAPAAPGKRRSRKTVVFGLILALAGGFGAYEGYGYLKDGRFMVSTDDAYVAADITQLAAKVSGYVSALEVVNNQGVKTGDVIARIDDVDYRLAVQAARDKVATQESTAARIGRQIEAARAQVTQAEPQIEAARAEAVRAAADFERQNRLAQSDFASKARFEQSRADRDRAEAAVRSAVAALSVARANVDVLVAQRVEAERNADEARTALARAERDLSFTVIRAPVDGVVGNRAVELGSYVQPGTRMMALVPLASVHVDANFKETQLANVMPGQTAHIEVDAYPGRDFPASVESIAPASGSQFSLLPPENATGNFTKIVQRVPVRVRIDPEAARLGLLRPGMSVVVRVDSRDRPGENEKR